MGKIHYELLKCNNCGKTIGYMYESVKVFPPEGWIHLMVGGPIIKIEKDVLCEECFHKSARAITNSTNPRAVNETWQQQEQSQR